MIHEKYSFYKTATFTVLLILNLHGSTQAMEDDYKSAIAPRPLAQGEKNEQANKAYDEAIKNLEAKKYDEAFRCFVRVAFQDRYHAGDFKSTENEDEGTEIQKCVGPLYKKFYSPDPLSESVLRMHGSVGYVYTLLKSNGEGLDPNCPIGIAMRECFESSQIIVGLINHKCSPETRRKLFEDSKGWKLENIS